MTPPLSFRLLLLLAFDWIVVFENMKISKTRVVAFALACAVAKAQEVIDLEKPLPVAPHHNITLERARSSMQNK